MKWTLLVSVACSALSFACADDKSGDDTQGTANPASSTMSATSPTTEPTTGGDPTGGDPTGDLPSMEVCDRYLDCVAAVAPAGLPTAQQGFGPGGTCWQGSAEAAQQCLDACQAGLDQFNEAFPNEPACGGMGGDASVASGPFLLALATTVDQNLPFQFLATFDIDAVAKLTLTLQPLTLGQGKVTAPREPIGPPLEFTGIPVVDGEFSVDLGLTFLDGSTNPITGADVAAELTLTGKIVDIGLVCGTASGEFIAPPIGDVGGSTFAAVHLDNPATLPLNVVVNCGGDAVTD